MDMARTSVLDSAPRPLSVEELTSAARLLGTTRPLVLAALALPDDELPGACWSRCRDRISYRGAHLEVRDADDPSAVADWAQAFWCDQDRSLPPVGPVHHWVRSVRSGSSRWVWGPAELWSGPRLRTTTDVTVQQVVDLLGRWWAGEDVGPPALVGDGDNVLLLDSDRVGWSLSSDAVARTADSGPAPIMADLAASLSYDVDGKDWALEPTGPTTWVCHLRLDGWTALVDLRVHRHSAIVGRPAHLPGSSGRTPALPPGWTVQSSSDDTVAAVHRTGLRAVLRRDTTDVAE
jgi:hypothetical protein